MRTVCSSAVVACALASAVALSTPSAHAQDITWNGLNSVSTGNGGTLGTDPADANNWLPMQVPTTGDRAIIKFNDFHGFDPAPPASDVVVVSSNTTFIPDALTYTMNNATDGVSAFVINKSMTMTDITSLTAGVTTTGDMISRLRISQGANTTLTLTGATPLDFTQSNFQVLNLGWVGDGATADVTYQNDPAGKAPNGFRTVVNLTNANITFAAPSQTATVQNDAFTVGAFGISGGSAQEDLTNANNSAINFAAVAGTINLATAGARKTGTLTTGYAQLNARSDQTWLADPTSLIRIHHKNAPVGFTNAPYLVGSITGARLDNMGQVHFYVDMMNDDFGKGTGANGRAMQIYGGTYGSIQVNTTPSGNNHTWMMLADNVTLASNGVQVGTYTGGGGNVNATTTPYGLTLAAGGAASSGNESSIFLNGKTLTVNQGVLLDGTTLARTVATNNAEAMKIDATASTLTVNGDVLIQSQNQSAADSNVDGGGTGNYASRRIGIFGDANTIVNLGGSFSTNTASLSSNYVPPNPPDDPLGVPLEALANGLSQATVNLVGGATLRTFEVGDASTKVDLNSDVVVPASQFRLTGGYSIGTLNVGNGVTAGNVQLVNNQLNDNAIVTPSGATSAGEKLIAGNLNVNTSSSLDLNGQTALVTVAATVNGTGNLKLGGGTLQGNLTINGGKLTGGGTVSGSVSPGAAAHTLAPSDGLPPATTNTMNLGSLATNANTTLAFHLVTPGASSVNDKIVVAANNGLTLGGGTLQITGSGVGLGSLGYYKAIQFTGAVTGSYTGITRPATDANKIVYTLDVAHDAGFIDIHRGFEGDADDSGTVNFADFVKLSNNYGLPNKGWFGGDFNGDGTTNFADFVKLSNNYGNTVGGGSIVVTADEWATLNAFGAAAAEGVPEPAGLALLGIGAAGLLARRRRNRAG
jgi:hypothetical protein